LPQAQTWFDEQAGPRPQPPLEPLDELELTPVLPELAPEVVPELAPDTPPEELDALAEVNGPVDSKQTPNWQR
jgi:hypothetical protein